MIADYRQRLGLCPTVNQVHRLHITLESLLTPAGLLSMWDAVCTQPEFWKGPEPINNDIDPAALRQVCVTWLEKLKVMHDLGGKPEPEPYQRRELTPTVTLFSNGEPPDGKSLLVCFTGSGHRPMMPPMTFVQCLDAGTTDLALLRDLSLEAYTQGLAHVADTLEGMQAHLPVLLQFHRYRRVDVLGISGGGIAALLSALRWNSAVGVAVGPTKPTIPRWTKASGDHVGMDLRSARQDSKTQKLAILYGAQSPPDKLAAEALASYIPVELMEISDPEGPVHHNALYPILRQGRLPKFLAEMYA
jgi:hypothetical protein